MQIHELNIPDKMKEVLAERNTILKIRKKDFFVEQGKLCKYVGIVLKGDFRTYMTVDGAERTISMDGESFDFPFITDYVAFLDKAVSTRTIQALSDAEVIILNYEQVMYNDSNLSFNDSDYQSKPQNRTIGISN